MSIDFLAQLSLKIQVVMLFLFSQCGRPATLNTCWGTGTVRFKHHFKRGDSYEKDVLPIINSVHRHPALTTLHSSFCNVTDDLNLKIIECFGHELDIDTYYL